jgi:hypothetical protein
MPHIPRSMAPSGLIDPASLPRAPRRPATQQKPPVPYLGSGNGEVNPTSRLRTGNQMVGKLSMKNWDVDPMKIIKQLHGKEFKVDEYSGMVS